MSPEPTIEQIPETLPRKEAHSRPDAWVDVLVIGAGPTGLACAIEAQKLGLKVLTIDKGCVVNSVYNYPANMIFFTTPELLEIGDIPFNTAQPKPTRQEALEYYRRVAEHYEMNIHQYEWVKTVTGENGAFRVTTTDRQDGIHDYRARKLIVATGYYDLPNLLEVPGEDFPKVHHYYREPHPFYDSDVAVVGGKNSAAESALDLWRHGARVTLVHRHAQLHDHIKYWVRPDIENRVKSGGIPAYFSSTVQENRTGFRSIGNPRRPGAPEERLCVCPNRLPPGLRFLARHGNRAVRGSVPSGMRSGNAGEQRSRHLRGRSDRGRLAHQRNLHRKWPLPRRTDRRRSQGETESRRRKLVHAWLPVDDV